METKTVNFKMDSQLKAEADELFAELGMNMTTAINVFIRQAVRQRKIPFEVAADMPNAETIAAMKEANAMCNDPHAKRYASFKELLAEVEADEV